MKDTFNTIKSNLYLRVNELRLIAILSVIGFVLGHTILRLVMELDTSDDLTSFELGTIVSAMIMFFTAVTVGSNNYASNINYAVSMGKRRRDIITAHAAVALVKSLLATSLIYAYHQLESYICRTTYRDIPMEFNFDNIFTSKVFFVILLFLMAMETFMGSMMTRFGQKTFRIMWIVCVLGFTFVPSAIEQTIEGTANDIVATIGQFFIDILSSLTLEGMLLGICGLCIILIMFPYILLRKHNVAI